ncbi:hypothetical protein KY285_001693 [Solanum tuberosum]|nr:hypothetical protein KY284_001848 [Solanum tuberosum]KAH0765822.1 hypothetical protein KY285_001693 [Solanum tuberosum]
MMNLISFLQQSFLEELEKTVALLAFEDVSNCPIGKLLDVSQRLKTASSFMMLIWAQNQLGEKTMYPSIKDLSTAKLEDPPV